MRGRRLLYGPPLVVLSDDTSANTESVSDNAALNTPFDDE